VFFLDSKSLRQEQRVDDWMRSRMQQLSELSRKEFRSLARAINQKFKNKDTSIFSDSELSEIYDQLLEKVLSDRSTTKKTSRRKGRS
jgi:2-phosphoglycerate kinase